MIWATNNRPRTNKTSSHTQIMMVHEPSNMDEPHEIRHRPRKISHSSFWTANRDVAKWTRLPVFLVKNALLAGLPRVFNSSKLGLPVSSQRQDIRWPCSDLALTIALWSCLGATCIPSLAGEKLIMVVDHDFIFVAQITIVVVASTYIPAA